MKIIYFGNNPRGYRCLETILDSGFQVSALVVHHKTQVSSSYSLCGLARQLKIPVFDPLNVNDPEFIETLKIIKPDLFVLSGYNPILKKEILAIPSKGSINLHGGRLPQYRGGSPINWQIINGEKQGACSILFVDEGIDTGDLLIEEFYEIGPDETAGEIILKTLEIFPRLLLKVLNLASNNSLSPKKQKDGTYFCKRYPRDGRIFWDDMTADEVHNLVRGLNGPELPGAFTFLHEKKMIIWKTKIIQGEIRGPAGRIALKMEDGVIVIAKDKGLLVLEVMHNGSRETVPVMSFFEIKGWSFD